MRGCQKWYGASWGYPRYHGLGSSANIKRDHGFDNTVS